LSVALSADGNTALIGGPTTATVSGGVGIHALRLDLDPTGLKLTGAGEASRAISPERGAVADGKPRWSAALRQQQCRAAWVFTRTGGPGPNRAQS